MLKYILITTSLFLTSFIARSEIDYWGAPEIIIDDRVVEYWDSGTSLNLEEEQSTQLFVNGEQQVLLSFRNFEELRSTSLWRTSGSHSISLLDEELNCFPTTNSASKEKKKYDCLIKPQASSYLLRINNESQRAIELRAWVNKETTYHRPVFDMVEIKNSRKVVVDLNKNNNNETFYLLEPNRRYPIKKLDKTSFLIAFQGYQNNHQQRPIVNLYERAKQVKSYVIPSTFRPDRNEDLDLQSSVRLSIEIAPTKSLSISVNSPTYIKLVTPRQSYFITDKEGDGLQLRKPRKNSEKSLINTQKISQINTKMAYTSSPVMYKKNSLEKIANSWVIEDNELKQFISEKIVHYYSIPEQEQESHWHQSIMAPNSPGTILLRAKQDSELELVDSKNRKWNIINRPNKHFQKIAFSELSFPVKLVKKQGVWPEVLFEYAVPRKVPLLKNDWNNIRDYETLQQWLNTNPNQLPSAWKSLHQNLNARANWSMRHFSNGLQTTRTNLCQCLASDILDKISSLIDNSSYFYALWYAKGLIFTETVNMEARKAALKHLKNQWEDNGTIDEAINIWLALEKINNNITELDSFLLQRLDLHSANQEQKFIYYWLTVNQSNNREAHETWFFKENLVKAPTPSSLMTYNFSEISLIDKLRQEKIAHTYIKKGSTYKLSLADFESYQLNIRQLSIEQDIEPGEIEINWGTTTKKILLEQSKSNSYGSEHFQVSNSTRLTLNFPQPTEVTITSNVDLAVQVTNRTPVTGDEEILPLAFNKDHLAQALSQLVYSRENSQQKLLKWIALRKTITVKQHRKYSRWIKKIDSKYDWLPISTNASSLPSVLYDRKKLLADRASDIMLNNHKDNAIILSNNQSIKMELSKTSVHKKTFLKLSPLSIEGMSDEKSTLKITGNSTSELVDLFFKPIDVAVKDASTDILTLSWIDPSLSRRVKVDYGYYDPSNRWVSLLPTSYLSFWKVNKNEPFRIYFASSKYLKFESLSNNKIKTNYYYAPAGWLELLPQDIFADYIRISQLALKSAANSIEYDLSANIPVNEPNTIYHTKVPLEQPQTKLPDISTNFHTNPRIDEDSWNRNIYAGLIRPVKLFGNNELRQEDYFELGAQWTINNENLSIKNKLFARQFKDNLTTIGLQTIANWELNEHWTSGGMFEYFVQQSSDSLSNNHYSVKINPFVKYEYRLNDRIRHAAELNWFYKDYSISSDREILFDPVDNDVYSNYGSAHNRAIRLKDQWSYWYAPDVQFVMSNQIKTNANYQSFDQYHFWLGANWAHKELITSTRWNAYYFWKDGDRNTATWSYRLDLAFRTPWKISETYNGWLRANIGYDPFEGDFYAGLYFSLGNDRQTLNDAWLDSERIMSTSTRAILLSTPEDNSNTEQPVPPQ